MTDVSTIARNPFTTIGRREGIESGKKAGGHSRQNVILARWGLAQSQGRGPIGSAAYCLDRVVWLLLREEDVLLLLPTGFSSGPTTNTL